MQKFKHLIIGNGICGSTAAETLRGKDAKASIAIIDKEENPLYSRVLLPNYIQGKIERKDIFLKKEEFYKENKIEFLKGRSVINIDAAAKSVKLDNDEEVIFEKLLIAAGGEVARPDIQGIDLKNVYFLRTAFDADDIIKGAEEISSFRQEKQKVLIWGGGFIGLELASSFAACGMGGYVVVRSPYYWANRLDEESAAMLTYVIENNGFKIITSTKVTCILGAESAEGVILENGNNLKCSALGIGVGIDPNIDFLKSTQLKINNGIEVNEYMETSVKDIYAAGDIAKAFNPIIGRYIRFGSWTNAMLQGKLAGVNMAGEHNTIDFISSYGAKYFDTSVAFVGDIVKDEETTIISRGTKDWHEQLFFRNNYLVGATIVNIPTDRKIINLFIKNRVKFQNIWELADINKPLESYI